MAKKKRKSRPKRRLTAHRRFQLQKAAMILGEHRQGRDIDPQKVREAAGLLGKTYGSAGGHARARKLSKKRQREIAEKAWTASIAAREERTRLLEVYREKLIAAGIPLEAVESAPVVPSVVSPEGAIPQQITE